MQNNISFRDQLEFWENAAVSENINNVADEYYFIEGSICKTFDSNIAINPLQAWFLSILFTLEKLPSTSLHLDSKAKESAWKSSSCEIKISSGVATIDKMAKQLNLVSRLVNAENVFETAVSWQL